MTPKMKKLVSLTLVTVIGMSLLGGCGSGNDTNKTAATTNSGSLGGKNEATKDPYEITIAYPVFGVVPKDIETVESEINKITQAKINATVKMLPISIGQFNQQMNLMLSGGEKLDLALVFGADGTYAQQAAAEQYLPLNDLLEKYGQGIESEVGAKNLSSAKISGELYGIPTLHSYGGSTGILMRKDLVDKYQIDVSKIHKFDDLDSVFKTIKDNEPEITPLAVGMTTPLDSYLTYDMLGDRLGVLPSYDNGLKVQNYYDSDEYANLLNKFHSWFKAGYINKDAGTTQQYPQTYLSANKAFAYIDRSTPGSLAQAQSDLGKELVWAELMPEHYITTTDVATALWTVVQNSKNPERAMMFLNLMYSDKDIANLLIWGVEGKHYVKVSDSAVDYPTGVTKQSNGYSAENWLMGNEFLTYTFKTADPEIWNKTRAYNEEGVASKALGFTFSSAAVRNEITALKNVLEQYKRGLESGTLDPADKLPEFRAKLKAAGIDKVIAEKQKQLDDWSTSSIK